MRFGQNPQKRKTHDIQAALLHSHRHVFLSKKEEEAPPDAGVLLEWKVGGTFRFILSFDCGEIISPARKDEKKQNS